LEEKKYGMVLNKEEIKEHSKKYSEMLKEKEKDRLQKAKFKVDLEHSSINNR
jgi:hypothetical protein